MNTVEAFIASQQKSQREAMNFLRHLILDIAPNVEEKISYRVPYFSYHGPLCYLNPQFNGVDLALTRGAELSNKQGLLQQKGRKQVSSIRFHSLAEAEEHAQAVRQILNEAIILNEHYRSLKKKAKK